jgi:septal ring factor EnvC (AmiA/AmiB activator)
MTRPLLFVLAGCVLAGFLALAWPSAPLHAQATQELDRLRGALRTLTAQARALEDQRAALQAQLNESNQGRSASISRSRAIRGRSRRPRTRCSRPLKNSTGA